MEQENQIPEEPALEPQKKTASSLFTVFLNELEACHDPEEKIRISLQFMQQCLSREGPPSFKDFWEARKLSLILFKENLSPKVRSQLWEKYITLTAEAYHLKEMIDSESSFAREQIENAIKALENNLQNLSLLMEQIPALEIPSEFLAIAANASTYNSCHQELQLMHSFAERAHSLRKEILKTEMRFRFKNKLLDNLTKIGDQIFPRRKELAQTLGTLFLSDVESYMKCSFLQELNESSIYHLKDTIKAFQYIVKQLYLNTEAFVTAKAHLSTCWEQIQVKDKERKTQIEQEKEMRRGVHDQISRKVQELEERFSTGGLQEKDLDLEYDQLQLEMRNTELGRDEVRLIKQGFQQIRNKFVEKQTKAHKEKRKIQDELENQRKQNHLQLKEEVEKMLVESGDLEVLQQKYPQLEQEKEQLGLTDFELVTLNALFRQLKLKIFDRRQEVLFALNPSDLAEKLQDLLDERKKMRQELKREIENLRKSSGGSSLDFEKAMLYRDLSETTKQLLDTLESAIIEIEEKIFDLE